MQKQPTLKSADCSWGILGYRRNISNLNEISIGRRCSSLHHVNFKTPKQNYLKTRNKRFQCLFRNACYV